MVNQALKRLLFEPGLALQIGDSQAIADLPDENAGLLAEVLKFSADHPELTTGALVEHYRATEHEEVLARQLETPPVQLEPDAESIEFQQAIESLIAKATRTSVLARAKAEMRRRAEDTK